MDNRNTIDYVKNVTVEEITGILPEVNLKNHDAVLHALQKQRGFILDLDSTIKTTVDNLFYEYHQFIRTFPTFSEELQKQYMGDESGVCGYYENIVKYGNKIGPRFFINDNALKKQTLPANIKNFNDELNITLTNIIRDTFIIISNGVDLSSDKKEAMLKFSILTSLHHNKPVTKEKLTEWEAENELTVTNDNKLESMATHKDTSAITLLIYRNNQSAGLEVKSQDKIYAPINLAKNENVSLKIAVILGREIEYLTPSLKGLAHRVVAQAIPESVEFSRDVINCFVYHPFAKFCYTPVKKMVEDKQKLLYKFKNPNHFFELVGENVRVQNLKREATLIKSNQELKERSEVFPSENMLEKTNHGLISYKRSSIV